MKTSLRRWLGAVTLAIAVVLGVALFVVGTPFLTLEHSDTQAFQDGGSVTVAAYEMHWPIFVLPSAGVVGVLLLLLPGRERRDA